jgi:hypothetical protein
MGSFGACSPLCHRLRSSCIKSWADAHTNLPPGQGGGSSTTEERCGPTATNRVRSQSLLKMRAMERTLSRTSFLARYARATALGPDDDSLPIITRRSDRSPHPHWCEVVGVAVHRRHGTWTHVYSCLFAPGVRPLVLLVRVMEGEQIDAAVEWIVAQSASSEALFARPPKLKPTPGHSPPAPDDVRDLGAGRDADRAIGLPRARLEWVPATAMARSSVVFDEGARDAVSPCAPTRSGPAASAPGFR